MQLSRIEELVADIREGKMVILMDDEDRENEGDLIIAATHPTLAKLTTALLISRRSVSQNRMSRR